LNDSILAGSRAPQLKGRILISRKEANGNIKLSGTQFIHLIHKIMKSFTATDT
jgi:hypothetical protein